MAAKKKEDTKRDPASPFRYWTVPQMRAHIDELTAKLSASHANGLLWQQHICDLEFTLGEAKQRGLEYLKATEIMRGKLEKREAEIVELEKRRVSDAHRATRALEIAEEATTAAGLSARVNIRLMDQLDQWLPVKEREKK